jgi:hypothetical protein
MNTLPDITETETPSMLSKMAGKLRDLPIWSSDDLLSLLINPQGLAGFSGLKKLIEKDYSSDDSSITGSVISS